MLVFAVGLVFDAIRTLFVMPAVGSLAAVLIELPFILAVSWMACSRVLQHFSAPAEMSHRLAMGAFALALLLVAEVLVSVTIDGRAISEHFALYKTVPTIIGLLAQIMFALFPLIQTIGGRGKVR